MFRFNKIAPLILGFVLGWVFIGFFSSTSYNKGKIVGLKEGLEIGYRECENNMNEISDLHKKSTKTYRSLDSLKKAMQIKYKDISKKVLNKSK